MYLEVALALPVQGSFCYSCPESIPLPPVGARVEVSFGARKKIIGTVVAQEKSPPEGLEPSKIKAIVRALDSQSLFGPDSLELAQWLSTWYHCSLGEALAVMVPSAKQERDQKLPEFGNSSLLSAPVQLSDQQEQALSSIALDIENSVHRIHYLDGITGSGKTEVFMGAAARCLAQGRSVMYLVPEIALTRQTIDAISQRLHVTPAVLHSHLTPSQRLKQWRIIQSQNPVLVIGARSAVFAPMKSIGLIIIDEEHEGSYKSGSSPRYHSRTVAVKRASGHGAVLLMGSATPSVEAWEAMERGTMVRHRLTKRLSGGQPPTMEIVSMKGVRSSISPQLALALDQCHGRGEQAIVFINRRGYASSLSCSSCGETAYCPQCSVPMTYHRSRGSLLCHYCGQVAKPWDSCPSCHSFDLGYGSVGTERVCEELARQVPQLRILRLDSDSTSSKGSLDQGFGAFLAGDYDVIVGTQMVAKGLNFPRVQLVGIVNADGGLNMPDFRASERSFGLLTQVAGRAGRYRSGAKVIIQTLQPGHRAISMAVNSQRDEFYRHSLDERREAGFPPFRRMYRLVLRGGDRGVVEHWAEVLGGRIAAIVQGLDQGEKSAWTMMGPAEAPLAVLNGNSRFHLVLLHPKNSVIHGVVSGALHGLEIPAKVYVEHDPDPMSVL